MFWTGGESCSRNVASCRLGWVVGLAVTLLSACGLIFSGVLFTRLSLLVPRAQVGVSERPRRTTHALCKPCSPTVSSAYVHLSQQELVTCYNVWRKHGPALMHHVCIVELAHS